MAACQDPGASLVRRRWQRSRKLLQPTTNWGGAVVMKRWRMIRMGEVFNPAAAAALVQLTHARRRSPSSVAGVKALPHPSTSPLTRPLLNLPPHSLSIAKLATPPCLALHTSRSPVAAAAAQERTGQPASKPARPVLSCPACEAGWRPLCSPPFYQPASPRIT